MAEIDSKNCDGNEYVGGGDDLIPSFKDNNRAKQVGSVSLTNSDLKRKLFSEDNENYLEIKKKLVNEYAYNSKRNKFNDSKHNAQIKTEKYEIEEEEQQKEAHAKVNGIVPESPNDATDNNSTAPAYLKSVATVKEEMTDDYIIVFKENSSDGENGEIIEEISAEFLSDEASNNATLPPYDIQRDIKTEHCDDANVERPEEIPAAEFINDEATMDDKSPDFKWDANGTKLLLALFKERKCDFRDPKKKKKNVWREILAQMEKHGIKGLDLDKVERKFRNLKQTYTKIKLKIKNNSTGHGPTKWEHFNDMKDIFADDWTIVGGSTISSLNEEKYDPFHDNSIISSDEDGSSSSFLKVNNTAKVPNFCNTPVFQNSKAYNQKQRYWQTNKIIKIEEERNVELSRIANAMEESNRLFKNYLTILNRRNEGT